MLDDGTVAGRDVRPVLGFVLDRYARAASLSRLIGRVESSERAGSLKQLLEGSLEFSRNRSNRCLPRPLWLGLNL